ncbi:hypothetical protein CAAN1_07S04522 [[Candida] anglica]|uniref:Deltamethrin resistance protein prag01 domain-containing protein n=1 Tax=[Candida] anglica TaxID=148631 RepID=A0ABP0EFY3_9ASCO
MLSRATRTYTPLVSKRFQHASTTSTTKSTFTNKYNFDLSPPQTHKYWNLYNSTLAFGIGFGVFATSDYIYGSYFDAISTEFSPLRRPLDNSAPVRDGKFA